MRPTNYHHSPTLSTLKGTKIEHGICYKLDLLAQLNCNADQLAGSFYCHRNAVFYDHHIDLLPSCCPATLTIKGIDVTSQYKKQLIRAYTKPRYMPHNQHRSHWDHKTVSSIAWRSLKVALRQIQRPTLCTKVCNDSLPRTNPKSYIDGD